MKAYFVCDLCMEIVLRLNYGETTKAFRLFDIYEPSVKLFIFNIPRLLTQQFGQDFY